MRVRPVLALRRCTSLHVVRRAELCYSRLGRRLGDGGRRSHRSSIRWIHSWRCSRRLLHRCRCLCLGRRLRRRRLRCSGFGHRWLGGGCRLRMYRRRRNGDCRGCDSAGNQSANCSFHCVAPTADSGKGRSFSAIKRITPEARCSGRESREPTCQPNYKPIKALPAAAQPSRHSPHRDERDHCGTYRNSRSG